MVLFNDLWPRTSFTCRISLVLWYSIVAFQWRNVWKVICVNLEFLSLEVIRLRCFAKFLMDRRRHNALRHCRRRMVFLSVRRREHNNPVSSRVTSRQHHNLQCNGNLYISSYIRRSHRFLAGHPAKRHYHPDCLHLQPIKARDGVNIKAADVLELLAG
jgi:hypothetical protein